MLFSVEKQEGNRLECFYTTRFWWIIVVSQSSSSALEIWSVNKGLFRSLPACIRSFVKAYKTRT